jgi:hypothetical protein
MKKSELQQIIREEISKVLNENKLTPERQNRLDSLRAEFISATDPDRDVYDDYNGRDEGEIIDDIRAEFGDKIANQIEDGSYEMHYSRQDYSASDKLADKVKFGSTSHRVTKDGKMNKQDVNKIKNYYKRGY